MHNYGVTVNSELEDAHIQAVLNVVSLTLTQRFTIIIYIVMIYALKLP